MRQKFRAPGVKDVVRVRHQHYQGEEHPATRKVDVVVSVEALERTKALRSPQAAHKFRLLAGPRWNSESDEVKIACEDFPHADLNENWCSDTLDRLVNEANVRRSCRVCPNGLTQWEKDAKDTFEDVPLDRRPTESRLRKTKKDKRVTLADYPKEWLS